MGVKMNCIYFFHLLGVCNKFECVPLEEDCIKCKERIQALEEFTIQDHDLFKIRRINFKLKERSMLLLNNDPFVDPSINSFKIVKFPDVEKRDKIKFILFNISKNEYQFEIFEIKQKQLSEFIKTLEKLGYSEEFIQKYRENIVEA